MIVILLSPSFVGNVAMIVQLTRPDQRVHIYVHQTLSGQVKN